MHFLCNCSDSFAGLLEKVFKRTLTCSLRVYILQDKRLFRSFGYNLRGHRARCRRRYSPRRPCIAAIPIICTEGLLEVGLYAGHVNGETFLDFVNNILTPCLLPFDGFNPRSVVILGNIKLYFYFVSPMNLTVSSVYSYSFWQLSSNFSCS